MGWPSFAGYDMRMPPDAPVPAPISPQAVVADALGTGLLVAVVVGSGIPAERLASGSPGLALLCNTLATGGGLLALILTFGPISGARFNPLVAWLDAWEGRLRAADAVALALAQTFGACAGTLLAHAMYGLPLLQASLHARTGPGQWLAEVVATFGLVGAVRSVSRHTPAATPFAVAAWIVGAYWFTASTSFANPAVTLARALTATYAGIRPVDVPAFVAAQAVGALAGAVTFRWLDPAVRA